MAKRRRRASDARRAAAESSARILLWYGLKLAGAAVDFSSLEELDTDGLTALARRHPRNGGARAALSALSRAAA